MDKVAQAAASQTREVILKNELPQIVQEEVQKAELLKQKEAFRFRNPKIINTQTNPDRKYMADVPFSYLRRMATIYPIARACINRRIRQITQLEWDITTIDEIKDEKGFERQIAAVKNFFKHPMGPKTRFKEMITLIIDDVLTLDAVCFEYQKTRGGDLLNLVPVDPSTIVLKVTDTGGTPLPPDPAYVQIILGQKVGEFTIDEMLYDFMGIKSYSPYGQAPLESLILQAEAAIRGTLYNLNYFRENNVPEGFLTLPDDVAQTKSLVEEWQEWFDSLVAGDPRMTHRLKILPGGATYTPAKKPEDMAFEKFELWLLQQTCAVFDVPPQDIGITYQVNKATSQTQQDLSVERGLLPLGSFVKELLDDVIQDVLGFDSLQFHWRNINPVDRKEESDIALAEIDKGVKSVDELRIEHGQEPIGLEHYVMTSSGPILVKDIIDGATNPMNKVPVSDPNSPQNVNNGDNNATSPQDMQDAVQNEKKKEKLMLSEIRQWRKCVIRDIEAGRALRKFNAKFIDVPTFETIKEGLKEVHSRFAAKIYFDRFLDPELRASMSLLEYAEELRKVDDDASLDD